MLERTGERCVCKLFRADRVRLPRCYDDSECAAAFSRCNRIRIVRRGACRGVGWAVRGRHETGAVANAHAAYSHATPSERRRCASPCLSAMPSRVALLYCIVPAHLRLTPATHSGTGRDVGYNGTTKSNYRRNCCFSGSAIATSMTRRPILRPVFLLKLNISGRHRPDRAQAAADATR